MSLGDTFNPIAINTRGQAVGNGYGDIRRPLLWQSGKAIDLNTLLPPGSGWELEAVTGINNRGDIVGYGNFLGDLFHAYLLQPWPDGSYTILGMGSAFLPNGINDRRQIIGKLYLGNSAPVLWLNGKIVDLNSFLPPGAGWQLQTADGINNLGDIIGSGTYRGDLLHGYWFKGVI